MGIIEKVFIWRFISIVITLIVTYAWAGNLISATGLTIVLQGVLLFAHWMFENWWLNQKVRKILGPEKNPPRKNGLRPGKRRMVAKKR